MTELLTAAQLREIMPDSPADKWAEPIVKAFERWGIVSAPARAAALAIWGEESGSFKGKREGLRYRPERMAVVWSRFAAPGSTKQNPIPTQEAIDLAARGEQAIANVVYADRLGNGPPESGDGWGFRGGCCTQITFHANWLACARAHGLDLSREELKAWADTAQSDRVLNASCSAWFFAVHARLLPLANTGNETDFLGAARRVGLPPDQRVVNLWLALWRRALAVLGGGFVQFSPRLDRERVKRFQKALNDAGAFPVLAVDGDWGPRTEAAADRFRHDNGLAHGDGPGDDLAAALGLA